MSTLRQMWEAFKAWNYKREDWSHGDTGLILFWLAVLCWSRSIWVDASSSLSNHFFVQGLVFLFACAGHCIIRYTTKRSYFN